MKLWNLASGIDIDSYSNCEDVTDSDIVDKVDD